jgi:hypothetical protein
MSTFTTPSLHALTLPVPVSGGIRPSLDERDRKHEEYDDRRKQYPRDSVRGGDPWWSAREEFGIHVRKAVLDEIDFEWDGVEASLAIKNPAPGPKDTIFAMEVTGIGQTNSRIEVAAWVAGRVQGAIDNYLGPNAFQPAFNIDYFNSCYPDLSKTIFVWYTVTEKQRATVLNWESINVIMSYALNSARDGPYIKIETSTGTDWYVRSDRHAVFDHDGSHILRRVNTRPDERPGSENSGD